MLLAVPVAGRALVGGLVRLLFRIVRTLAGHRLLVVARLAAVRRISCFRVAGRSLLPVLLFAVLVFTWHRFLAGGRLASFGSLARFRLATFFTLLSLIGAGLFQRFLGLSVRGFLLLLRLGRRLRFDEIDVQPRRESLVPAAIAKRHEVVAGFEPVGQPAPGGEVQVFQLQLIGSLTRLFVGRPIEQPRRDGEDLPLVLEVQNQRPQFEIGIAGPIRDRDRRIHRGLEIALGEGDLGLRRQVGPDVQRLQRRLRILVSVLRLQLHAVELRERTLTVRPKCQHPARFQPGSVADQHRLLFGFHRSVLGVREQHRRRLHLLVGRRMDGDARSFPGVDRAARLVLIRKSRVRLVLVGDRIDNSRRRLYHRDGVRLRSGVAGRDVVRQVLPQPATFRADQRAAVAPQAFARIAERNRLIDERAVGRCVVQRGLLGRLAGDLDLDIEVRQRRDFRIAGADVVDAGLRRNARGRERSKRPPGRLQNALRRHEGVSAEHGQEEQEHVRARHQRAAVDRLLDVRLRQPDRRPLLERPFDRSRRRPARLLEIRQREQAALQRWLRLLDRLRGEQQVDPAVERFHQSVGHPVPEHHRPHQPVQPPGDRSQSTRDQPVIGQDEHEQIDRQSQRQPDDADQHIGRLDAPGGLRELVVDELIELDKPVARGRRRFGSALGHRCSSHPVPVNSTEAPSAATASAEL